jgi:NO-binding membrane sensor protein with MHYT domain
MLSQRAGEQLGDRPGWDLAFAAVAVGAHAVLVWRTDLVSLLARVPTGRREAIYETGATVASIVFGFSVAAVTFYLSAQGDRMVIIRRRIGAAFRRNWRSTLSTPLVAAGAFFAFLVFDNSAGTPSLAFQWLLEFVVALVIIRSVRLGWLLMRLLEVADQGDDEMPLAPAPSVGLGSRSA